MSPKNSIDDHRACLFRAIAAFICIILLCIQTLNISIQLPSFTTVYNLFVLMSLLYLVFKIRDISGQCHICSQDGMRLYSNFGISDCYAINVNGRFYRNNGVEEVEESEFNGEGIDVVITKLRRELLKERELREAVMAELEAERKAASSAANEALAKIQRLQIEKASIELEARQNRAIAEQKQLYDREVIENLRWIISNFTLKENCEGEDLFEEGLE